MITRYVSKGRSISCQDVYAEWFHCTEFQYGRMSNFRNNYGPNYPHLGCFIVGNLSMNKRYGFRESLNEKGGVGEWVDTGHGMRAQ